MWDIDNRIQPEWLYGVAGNITRCHYDKDGVLRYGTKAFRAGTKVYLASFVRDDGKICVIGLSRKRRKKRRQFIEELIDVKYIENLRLTRIFNTAVIERMIYEDYGMVADMEITDDRIMLRYTSDCFIYWGNTEEDRTEINRFLKELKKNKNWNNN